MPAKLVVTARKGGSRISLLGSSGKELLASAVFSEPRAKGATLRALKGLLGEVTIEDHTLAGPGRAKAPAEPPTPARRPGRPKGSSTKAAAKSPDAAAPMTAAETTPVAEAAPAKKARKVTAKRRATKASATEAPAPKATAARRQAAARIASNTAVARV